MTLNNKTLKKMEMDFPFKLTPEQKSILLLWFGADSKFGWSTPDFILGAHRVRRFYPDHRMSLCNTFKELPEDPLFESVCDYDHNGNCLIQFYENDSEDNLPF